MPDVTASLGSVEAWIRSDDTQPGWKVLDARLQYATHLQQVSPHAPVSLDDFFVPQVARTLETHLRQVTETAVFSQPEFALDLPGLRLEGLRVLAQVAGDGTVTTGIRIARVSGDPGLALHPDMRGWTSPRAEVESLALPMLQDLLMPALEVVDHILEHGLTEEDARVLRARVKIMCAKRDELSDYIGLLTRYARTAAQEESRAVRGGSPFRLEAGHALPNRAITWHPSQGAVRGETSAILHGHHVPDRRAPPAADRYDA